MEECNSNNNIEVKRNIAYHMWDTMHKRIANAKHHEEQSVVRLYDNRYTSTEPYLETIEILDIDVCTKFVMFEKHNRYGRNQFNHKVFKRIIKKGDDNKIYSVCLDINKYKRIDDGLEKNLDIKKYNVFYDKEDINQVIQYYRVNNIEF
jgi:hypothetical protein